MANERLRAAMAVTHVSVDELARAAEVDPKTVQRWLAGRIPHARHRWAVATRLAEDQSYRWPDAHRRTGPDSTAEVIAAYAHRADMPSTAWPNSCLEPDTRSTSSATRCCSFLSCTPIYLRCWKRSAWP
ncbi:MAG: hypothetical protein ACRDYX_03150 [Egibacteraceae bacterium]